MQAKHRIETSKIESESKKVAASYSKILLANADSRDKAILGIGIFASILTGLGLPSFVFLFGDIINAFGDNPDGLLSTMRIIAIEFTIIGVIIWITSYFYFSFMVIYGESVSAKTRIQYLSTLLKQEPAWFDQANTSELSARLSKECQAIQRAIGEKFGGVLFAMFMSVSGLALAFTRGWLFSFILFGAFPIIVLATALIGKSIEAGTRDNLKAYGQSAGYAEQALNAIKVVQAFG